MKRSRDPRELERKYGEWPDERLLTALHLETEQYDPSVIPVMRRVLDGRGLPAEESDALLSEIHAERESEVAELSRVRGWLVVWIIVLALNSLILLLAGGRTFLVAPPGLVVFVALPMVAVGFYGFYCAYLLVKKRSQAPENARRWLILGVTLNCFTALALWGVFEARVPLAPLLGSVYFTLLWLEYLSESRRAACVYQTTDRPEVETQDNAQSIDM
jgi:hypothetical protein